MANAVDPYYEFLEEGNREDAALLFRHAAAMTVVQDPREAVDGLEMLTNVVAPTPEVYAASLEEVDKATPLPFPPPIQRQDAKYWRRNRKCWNLSCLKHFMPDEPDQLHCSLDCEELDDYEFEPNSTCLHKHPREKATSMPQVNRHGKIHIVCLVCRRESQRQYDQTRRGKEVRQALRARSEKKRAPRATRSRQTTSTGTSAKTAG